LLLSLVLESVDSPINWIILLDLSVVATGTLDLLREDRLQMVKLLLCDHMRSQVDDPLDRLLTRRDRLTSLIVDHTLGVDKLDESLKWYIELWFLSVRLSQGWEVPELKRVNEAGFESFGLLLET